MKKRYPRGTRVRAGTHSHGARENVLTRSILKRLRQLAIARITATGNAGELETTVLSFTNAMLEERTE